MRRTALVVGIAVTLIACEGSAPPRIERVFDPHEGDAYPNRRAKVVYPASGTLLAISTLTDTVTATGLADGSRVGAWPLGLNPVDSDGPRRIVVDRTRGQAYVVLSYRTPSHSGPHAASVNSPPSGFVQALALDDFRPVAARRVDPDAWDLAASGRQIAVVHNDFARSLDEDGGIDGRRASLLLFDADRIDDPPKRLSICVAPRAVELSRPDPSRALVACHGEDSVVIVDLEAPEIETRIPIGPDPVRIDVVGAPRYGPHVAALSPDGSSLAVGCSESADVRFVDVASGALGGAVLPTAGVPQRPGWSADGSKLYVPIGVPELLVVFDVASGTEIARRSFAAGECTRPVEAVVHETGVWLACEGITTNAGAVLALDPATLETLRRADAGDRPSSLAVIDAAQR